MCTGVVSENQDDVSEWSDICVLVLFQRINTIKIKLIILV
jgi:hypothetical protein